MEFIFNFLEGTLFDSVSLANLISAVIVWLVVVAIGLSFKKIVISKLRKVAKTSKTEIDDMLIIALDVFGKWSYIVLGIFIASITVLDFTALMQNIIFNATFIWFGFQVGRIISREIDFYLKGHIDALKKEYASLATALPTIGTIVKGLVWVLIASIVLSNLGVNVTALVAGLGIGGIAFAFAFQKILADLFSAFVIFFDKPFVIGDSVDMDSISGYIEHIGIKTTKVRAWTGELYILPNESLVSGALINNTRVEKRMGEIMIPIDYDTTNANLRKVESLVTDIVKARKDVEFSFIHLVELDERSILFKLRYHVLSESFEARRVAKEEIILDILETLRKNKIELGYPVEFRLGGKK